MEISYCTQPGVAITILPWHTSLMIDWLTNLHSSQGISEIIRAGGTFVLIAIVFAETGLLFGFFLPGDSLFITAGVLCNPSHPQHVAGLDPLFLNIVLSLFAIIGDQTGFWIGRLTGERIWKKPDTRFYKRKHLVAAHDFYEKHGAKAIVGARFVPIFRTFVPFAAGVAKMPYKDYFVWSVVGGILWITSMIWIGYYLGATPLANRLDKLIIVVVFVSLLPMVITGLKNFLRSKAKT